MDQKPKRPLDDELPPNAGMLGVALFLGSLTVLFAASVAAYAIIRWSARDRGLEFGSLHVPQTLWLSTAIILASSVTIHMALRAVRAGRQSPFRRFLVATAALAVAFLLVQAPSLYWILESHQTFRGHDIYLYGLILMLIALHALHVLGGIIPLGVVTGRALQGRYSSGRHEGVRYCAVYWHFLDVVWLVMFTMFYTMG